MEKQKAAFDEDIQYLGQGYNFDEDMQKAGFAKSDELQTILDNIVAAEKEKNPYFPCVAPFSGIEKADESIDELLMASKYDIKACLTCYYNELVKYEVNTLFQKANFDIKYLFEILKGVCTYISENTDKPLTTQNKITELLQESGKSPGFGNVLQILILQGVIKWFENCNINEGDTGYTEAQELCNFVNEQLIEACTFYFMFFEKNDNSRPLDNYLFETNIGKAWLELQNQPQQSDTKKPQPTHFNRHFTTDEQKKLFEGLTKGGFLPKDADYRHFCYVFGGTAILNNEKPFEPLIWGKSVGLLAYMIDTLFSDTDGTNLWETTEKCFVWKEKAPNKDSMKNTVSKYKNDFKEKPKGFEKLDTILSL
ncbi:hypothetical protein AGMMS50276_27410 [Synergistales bacterium]|nr:hypothetical protein AGMMS50276_27410 [Synergistales bacterium]